MASKRQKNELGKLADNLSTGRADNAPSTVPSLGPEAAAGLDGPGFGSLSAAIVLPPPGTHVKLLDGGEWWSGRVERHAPAGLIVAFLDSDEKLTAEWYGKKAPRCTNGSCATIAYEDVAESLKVCRRAKATRAAKSESAGERRGRAQKIEKEAPDSSRGQCAGCGASLCRSAPAAAAHCKQGVQGAGKPGAGKPAHDQRCKQRWIERVQGGAVVSKYCNLTCAGREHDNVDVKLSHGRPDHLGATFRRAAPPPQSFSSSSSSSSPPGIEVASSKRRHTAEQASLIEKASLIEAHVRARLEAQLRAQLRAELKAELKAEVEAARVAAQRKAEAKAEAKAGLELDRVKAKCEAKQASLIEAQKREAARQALRVRELEVEAVRVKKRCRALEQSAANLEARGANERALERRAEAEARRSEVETWKAVCEAVKSQNQWLRDRLAEEEPVAETATAYESAGLQDTCASGGGAQGVGPLKVCSICLAWVGESQGPGNKSRQITTLACCHTFCAECIKKLCAANLDEEGLRTTRKMVSLKCPNCRAAVREDKSIL